MERHYHEVSPKRREEYKKVVKSVDARAKKLTRERMGMEEDEWWMGACHEFWDIKKRILRDEYHMVWRSPKDLNPGICFD